MNFKCIDKPKLPSEKPDYKITFLNDEVLGVSERDFRELQKVDDGSWRMVKIEEVFELKIDFKEEKVENKLKWFKQEQPTYINIGSIWKIEKIIFNQKCEKTQQEKTKKKIKK